MNVIREAAPGGDSRVAVVMLPGAGDRAQDLVERGFIRSLRQRGLAVDVVAVDPPFDDYLDDNVAARLERDVIAALRASGVSTWLMGISLGGLGALSYAREHGGSVEGVVLLAPFVGTRGLVAEIARAGGLERWQPGTIAPDDAERRTLAWLAGRGEQDPAPPPIFLGYGTEDRYAPASVMLARRLPRERVVSLPGGHDWVTWLSLWERLLDRGVLHPQPAAAASK